jgi:thioredoxin-like negative regulator of GroEL
MRLLPILDELAREYAGILKIVKLNTGLEQALPGQFGVRGIPHLVLFEKGVKIAESSGFMPKHQLLAWIREKTALL